MLLNRIHKTCTALLQGMMMIVTLLLIPACSSLHQAPEAVLDVKYEAPQLAQQLKTLGVADAYMQYWQAHLARDWKRRFTLESNLGNVTEKFYVAYYNKAWEIKTFSVSSVEEKDAAVVVIMAMGLADPDTGKVSLVHRADRWIQREGQWLHVNDDPFLVGMTQ